MPRASQTSAARRAQTARTQQATAQPQAVRQRLPRSKVGWDRKFRLMMVGVFALVGWIGFKAALAMYSAHQQAGAQSALVRTLNTQHQQLQAQVRALKQPATIMRDARHLGMVRQGERAYVVISSSGN